MSVERRGTKALELWAKRATNGYAGVNISNMTTDWRNGLAFCALIHHFRPELIEYDSLKPENILENNALAFRIAEQQLGIPALLDAEDMVECDIPDRLSVLTYVSQFYQVFSALGLTSQKRVVNKTSPQSSPNKGANKLVPSPQPKTKTEIKTDKVLAGGRLRREVCVGCNNPVFLAERLLVGSPGQLMHRTCFRCARCNTQLTLASYYETEKGQFCCETCPDEEIPISATENVSLSPTISRRTSASESSGSEYESEGSDNESECSNNAVTDSPKGTPGQPKPRTIFLSKTLEGEDNDHSSDSNLDKNKEVSEQQFSKVSPALFGSKDAPAAKVNQLSLNHCDDAKGMITDPPDRLTLDTGQGTNATNLSNNDSVSSSSSIVAQRLKLFRERETNNDKIYGTDIKSNNDDNDNPDKGNKNLLPSSEKNSSLQLKSDLYKKSDDKQINKDISEKPIASVDSDKNKNTRDSNVACILNKYERLSTSEITSEKDINESVNKSLEPEITNKNRDIEKEEKTIEEKETVDDSSQSVSVDKLTTERNEDLNPFGDDDDEESQLKENPLTENETQVTENVVDYNSKSENDVDNSEKSEEVVDSNAKSLTQDNDTEIPSQTQPNIQYPDDLNPFGSDVEDADDKDINESVGKESLSVDNNKIQSNQEETGKKLIKVNYNPFDSDEDEDVFDDESKEKENKETKNLNPFWSDDEEPVDGDTSSTPKKKPKPPRPPPPTLARNSVSSQMLGYNDKTPSPQRSRAEYRKISAPTPPKPSQNSPSLSTRIPVSPTLSTAKSHPSSSPGGSVALRKKVRRAPAPPPQAFTSKNENVDSGESTADTASVDTLSLSSLNTQTSGAQKIEEEGQDEVMSWKMQKDMKNHSNKMNKSVQPHVPPPKPARCPEAAVNYTSNSKGLVRSPSISKSEAGEWKRKKGPAPSRPVPQKRAIRKMPMRQVQQELQDIEIQQSELERQGVILEQAIRKRTESNSNNPEEDMDTQNSGPSSIEVEDMILQLFELVNEKNDLFRRQTELMYLKREKRLEEEYVDLEYQIRCLMLKPPTEKSEIDTAQEEELIARLVKVVEQRDEIINCLELDRLREAQEDESIATHMMQYQEKHIDGIENRSSIIQDTPKKKKLLKLGKRKKKKEKKDKKDGKIDADKDIDETEVKDTKKKKKKWLFS